MLISKVKCPHCCFSSVFHFTFVIVRTGFCLTTLYVVRYSLYVYCLYVYVSALCFARTLVIDNSGGVLTTWCIFGDVERKQTNDQIKANERNE